MSSIQAFQTKLDLLSIHHFTALGNSKANTHQSTSISLKTKARSKKRSKKHRRLVWSTRLRYLETTFMLTERKSMMLVRKKYFNNSRCQKNYFIYGHIAFMKGLKMVFWRTILSTIMRRTRLGR